MTGIMPVCVQVEEQKNTQAGMMLESGQKETGLNPAHPPDGEIVTVTGPIHAPMNHDGIPDGIEHGANMTGTVTIQTIEEAAVDIQTGMMPQSDTERTKAVSDAIKGTVNDSIVSDLDDAIIRVRARQAALASFNQEKQKQKQPGAPASIGDVFKGLFGVQLPSGSDQAAAAVMIARKKAGKLDNVKSPLAYLSSLAGKVQTPIVTSSVQLPPAPVITSQLVTETSLDDYERRSKIKAAWFGLNDEQRMPFHELREKKNMSPMPGRKVPVELLAFQQFTQECLAGRVQI